MAGSYRHCIDPSTGKLLVPEEMLLDNMGDVYEAIYQMYGMIWYMADGNEGVVDVAAKNWRRGIQICPGVLGHIHREDDEDEEESEDPVRPQYPRGQSMPWPFNFEPSEVLKVIADVFSELPEWQRKAFEAQIGYRVIERSAATRRS